METASVSRMNNSCLVVIYDKWVSNCCHLLALELHITSQVARSSRLCAERQKQCSPWVCIYLQNWHQYSIYMTLLPDLADYHKEKFRNFMQMDLETFKELFELVNVNGLMLLVTDCCIVSFHVVSFVKLH